MRICTMTCERQSSYQYWMPLTLRQGSPLDAEASLEHVLQLYSVSSPKYLDFAGIHTLSGSKLLDLCENPLEIDFNEWKLLKTALESAPDENEIVSLSDAYVVVDPLIPRLIITSRLDTPVTEESALLCIHCRPRNIIRRGTWKRIG